MADPLSITLAVIAFATAIRDLKEVADEIKDAFSKLPKNYANARKLMDEVGLMLQRMLETYEEDMEEYDNDGSVKKSLDILQVKMTNVKNECAGLLSPDANSSGLFDRSKLGLRALWHRNKVEALISDLKVDVKDSMDRYMLLATIRIEMKVGSILSMIKPPANDTNIIKPVGRIMASALLSSVQSNSSHIPATIPLQDLPTIYLVRELETLEGSLQAQCNRWFANLPPEPDIPPLQVSWFLDQPPVSSAVIRREAFLKTGEINGILGSPNHLWIYEVGTRFGHLSTFLDDLQMQEDVIRINKLRADLWSATATVYPNSTASDYHAQALTDLSIAYFNLGDKENSTIASNQAISIIGAKPDTSITEDIKVLLARNLAAEALSEPMSESALEMAQSSVRKVEDVLGIAGAHTFAPNDTLAKDDFANIIFKLMKSATLHDHLFVYATVLFRLSEVQAQNDILEASNTGKKAFDTLWKLLSIYRGSSKILHLCSSILVHLYSSVLIDQNTETETRERYININVNILNQLASENPQRYVLGLLSALHAKRQILLEKGNAKEAKAVLQKITDLVNLAADPHPTLKLRSELEGDYHSQLAKYHLTWGNLQQAIYSAQNGISCYEALNLYAKQFSISVFQCKCLAFTHQYDTALFEGKKALKIWDSNESLRQGNDIAIINTYMELLDKMMDALDASSDTRALEWADEINARIQNLFRSSRGKLQPTNAQAPHKYASIMRKHNLVDKAIKYLQNVLETWDDTYGTSRQNMMGISYLQCLTALPELSKDICDTDKALLYCHQSLAFAAQYFSTATERYQRLQDIFRINLNSMHVRLLCDAGPDHYHEAFKLSGASVKYAERSYIRGLPQALCSRTICELYLHKPDQAKKTATEVIKLCKQELDTRSIQHSDPTLLSLLYASLLNLANALGDIGGPDNIGMALTHLQEAKDTLKKYEMAICGEVGSDEGSYLALTTCKSRLLFAKGDHDEAGRLVTEVIHHVRELTKISLRYIPALVQALRYGGIVYCTLDSFDKGNATMIEIAQVKRELADKSPNIARLVEMDESQLTARGLWKSVQAAKDQLKCSHQDH